MLFCSNCGIKMQDGDTFCGNCGANCKGVNIDSQQNVQHQNLQQPAITVPSINTEAVSKHSKQTLAVIFNMVIKPVSSIKSLVHTLDQKSTIIIGIVLAIIQGILSLWKFQQLISVLDKTIAKFASFIGTIMSLFQGGSSSPLSASDVLELTRGYNGVRQIINIPYGNAFLHGIILYLVVVVVMFLGIFVAAKLLSKATINALNIGKIAILATIPALGGEFLNIIFSYISSPLGVFILLIGILASFTSITMNIKEIVAIEDDKLVYALSIVFSIVIACALFAMWKFIISDVNSIKNSITNNVMNILK